MHYPSCLLKVLLALIFMTENLSFGDTLTTPFNIELSPPSALALLGGVSSFKTPSGELKTNLPNQNLSSPYPVSLTGIHLTLDYAFNTPTTDVALNKWNIQSKSISAEVIIDSISITQTVVEQSNGTTLTLTVTASCSDVHLSLIPGSTQANATVDLALSGNKTAYTLNNFSANWTPSAWQVTSLNCRGPNGFPDLVKQNLTTQLKSINPFLPAIRTQIQAQLDSSAGAVSWSVAATDQSGIALNLVPNNLQVLPAGGALVNGTASFVFTHLENTSCQKTITEVAASPTSTDTLVVPMTTIEGLAVCGYLNGSPTTSFTSQNFPAFESLLGNGLEKIFVWPNLVKFNSSQIFNFTLAPTGKPALGRMSSNKAGSFLFNLDAPMTLQMYAPETSGPIHYLDFSSDLSGPSTLSVHNSVLTFKQNTKRLNLSAKWAQIYLDTYHPDQFIWTSVMAGYLKSFLSKTGMTYTLPTFESPGAFSISIDSAIANGTSANIGLGIKTLSSQTQ